MDDKLKQFSADAQNYIERLRVILKEGQDLDSNWSLYDTLLTEDHIADSVIPQAGQTKKDHFGTVINNLQSIITPFTAAIDTNFERFNP